VDEKRKLCFNWGISDHYGWGIYGLNLLIYGQMSNAFQPFPLKSSNFLYPLDPLAHKFIYERLPQPNTSVELKSHDIFLTALGNSNQINIDNKYRNIGVIFNETNPLPQDEIEKLKDIIKQKDDVILEQTEIIDKKRTKNIVDVEVQAIKNIESYFYPMVNIV
jgi:hypothetical protein